MIKESVFLFLLIGTEGSIEEKYVGRLQDCLQSKKVYEQLMKKYKNINGYLCLDKAHARKKFLHKPTPKENHIIKNIQEYLIPTPLPKPPMLKKRKPMYE
tara:strand:- start:1601 stop:1900 length:300 start_codon:yes stop_codon:yes gene_type:complete